MRGAVQHQASVTCHVRRRLCREASRARDVCMQVERAAACKEPRAKPAVVRKEQGPPQGERGSAKGRWFITSHSIERFRERVAGKRLSYEQALGALIRIAESAHRVMTPSGPKTTKHGFEVWRSGKPWRLRLWVSRAREGKPQLVTVLTAFDK